MILRGALDTPDSALSSNQVQCEFFRALNRLAPAVLEELNGAPLELFLKDQKALKAYGFYDWRHVLELTYYREPGELDLTDLRKAIEAWAAKWQLSALWVYDCACETLARRFQGGDGKVFFTTGATFTPATSPTSRAVFPEKLAAGFEGFMGYEPTFETAQDFKQRFEKVCNAVIDEHIAGQHREAASRNYTECRDKRKLEQHLEWVVLKQVYGYSAEDISNALGLSRISVKQALDDTFRLIQLEPRKLAPGRPKGDESKNERKARVEAEICRLLQ